MGKMRRIRRGERVWQRLVSQQRASGLTVPAYCRREGINAVLFYRWRAKLNGLGSDQAPLSDAKAAAVSAPFIDLGAFGSGSARCEVRVEFGGGVVLTLARS